MHKIGIIGGGASGFFAAIQAASLAEERQLPVKIILFEAGAQFLSKVKISGGGRCNVTHSPYPLKQFVTNYPRGQKELLSPFHQFQAQDTINWFNSRGVDLKTEQDNRIFPKSDSSQSIINCLLEEAKKLDVQLLLKHAVEKVNCRKKKFEIEVKNRESFEVDSLIISTGSSKSGYKIIQSLNHNLTQMAPSLFSFKINSPLLKNLSGTSFKQVKLNIKLGKKFEEIGPMLITHWGLSGPAILKLSAWAAREFKQSSYKGLLTINWLNKSFKEVEEKILLLKKTEPQKLVANTPLQEFSKRFWLQFLEFNQIDLEKKWIELNKASLNRLIEALYRTTLSVDGKNRYKDEFVECGGVDLKEINLRSMESKLVPNLFITGELLDIDGITGGFNFQNAWSSGFIAGSNAVLKQMAE